jgi:hypothetical protein
VDGLGVVRTAKDVKVASAQFDFVPQAPVGVTLNLVGISDAANYTPTGLADTVLVAPYIFKDVVVGHQTVLGNADTGINCRSVSFSVDNSLDDPAEGLRLNGDYFPATLYNNRYGRVTGSIEKDYQSNALGNAFVAQHESLVIPTYDWNEQTYDGWLQIAMSRAGLNLAFNMYRIRYTDWTPRISGSRSGIQTETAPFVALTYWDGDSWVDPLVSSWSEE